MTLIQAQLATLCHIADEAGREILSVYDAGGAVWEKTDRSPLTEADLRTDRVIRTMLEKHFPGVYILSEESCSAGEISGDELFIVDPLDGTKEFIKRNGEFTVNIALVAHGQPVAGVVLAPALNELFYGAYGLGVWKRNASGHHPIHCAPRQPGQPLRVIGSRSHGGEQLAGWLAALTQPYNFVAAGSSLKFCRIAEGFADIYPRFGPTCQWDTAAAHCILVLAGGTVTDLARQPLRYGPEQPLLNPAFIATGLEIDATKNTLDDLPYR